MLAEEDPLLAYLLDRAVFTFGTTLDGELDVYIKDDKNGKRTLAKKKQILAKWLPGADKASKSGFKDPRARG